MVLHKMFTIFQNDIYCAAFAHQKNSSVVIYAVIHSFPFCAAGRLRRTTYFNSQLSAFRGSIFCVLSLLLSKKKVCTEKQTDRRGYSAVTQP